MPGSLYTGTPGPPVVGPLVATLKGVDIEVNRNTHLRETKYNPKIYLSIEEIFSHYESREDIKVLYFYNKVFYLPVLVGKDGKVEFLEPKKNESSGSSSGINFKLGDKSLILTDLSNKYLFWDTFIKTGEVVFLLDKLSKLGIRFGEEISHLSDFIKSFGKPWISNRFRDSFRAYDPPSYMRKFYRSGVGMDDKERIFLDQVKELEKGVLVKTIFEDRTVFVENKYLFFADHYKKDFLNFDLDGTEEKFSEVSLLSEAIFGETFVRMFHEFYVYHEKGIALIKPSRQLAGGVNVNFHKPRKYYPLLTTEKKELTEAGALVLYPEFILVESGISGGEEKRGLAMFIVEMSPNIAELGLLYIGADGGTEKVFLDSGRGKEEAHLYNLTFAPFLATDSEILLRAHEISYYKSSEELSDIDTNRHLPVITISRKKFDEKERPNVQVFTFSRGPQLLLFDNENNLEQEYLYAPLFECLSIGGGNKEEETKVLRGSFWDSESIENYYRHLGHTARDGYEKYYNVLFKDLADLDSLVDYGVEELQLDLLSYRKVERMTKISEEILRSYTGRVDERERGVVDLANIDRGLEEYSTFDEPLCFLGEGVKKVIIRPLGEVPEVYKSISKIGVPLIGSSGFPRDHGVFHHPNPSEPNIYWYMGLMMGKAFDPMRSKWAEGFYRATEDLAGLMRYVGGKRYMVKMGEDKVKEQDKIIRAAKDKLKKAPHEASALILQTLNNLSRSLKGGVYTTLVVEYSPIVSKGYEAQYNDEEQGSQYFSSSETTEHPSLRKRAERGETPKLIKSSSDILCIFMVFDFKEDGVRLIVGASPSLGTMGLP